MTVTETLMGHGSFNVRLREDTPPSVLRQLTVAIDHPKHLGLAHVVLTDGAVPAAAFGDAEAVFAASTYTGIIEGIDDRSRRLTGYGLAGWLATPDGHGDLFTGSNQTGPIHGTRKFFLTSGSWLQWMIEGGTRDGWPDDEPTTIRRSSLTTTIGPGTFTLAAIRWAPEQVMTRLEMVEMVCAKAGLEWKITPQFQFQAAADLWPGAPRAIVGDVQPDREWITITGEAVEWSESLDGWGNHHVALRDHDNIEVTPEGIAVPGEWEDEKVAYRTTGAVSDVLNRWGEPVWMSKELPPQTRAEEPTRTDWANRAFIDAVGPEGIYWPRRQFSLAGDLEEHDHARLEPGEMVGVYDPTVGVYDTASPVVVAGRTVHPVAVRLQGITRPIHRRQGVYIVYWDRTSTPVLSVLDLSRWVEPDTSDATLDVGALQRTIAPRRRR